MVATWDSAVCGECGMNMLEGPHASTCSWACRMNENRSHHWLPVRDGRNSAGEPVFSQRCTSCGATFGSRS